MSWRHQHRRMSASRRRLLIGLGAAGAVLGAGGIAGVQRFRTAVPPELMRRFGTEPLQEPEMRALVALTEVLVPPRYWIGAEASERLIQDAVAGEPGLGNAYADAANLLNEEAGSRFATLKIPDRESVLESLFWQFSAEFGETTPHVRGATRVRGLKRGVERAWMDERRRRFRDLVVSDLLERLYLAATPCLLGYENTQGVPGGPRSYVNPPEPARQVCGAGEGV